MKPAKLSVVFCLNHLSCLRRLNTLVCLSCLSLISFAPLMASPSDSRADHTQLIAQIAQTVDNRIFNNRLFTRALASNDLRVQKAALLGLGRIGDAEAIKLISPFLHSNQPAVRNIAAFALGISKQPAANKPLVNRLAIETEPQVQAAIYRAIGNIGAQGQTIKHLLSGLDGQPEVIAAMCDGLTLAWTFHPDKVSVPNSTQVTRLLALSMENPSVAKHCLFTLVRLRFSPQLFNPEQLLNGFRSIKDSTKDSTKAVEIKQLLLRIIAEQSPAIFQTLVWQAIGSDHSSIRIEAALALSKFINKNAKLSEQDHQAIDRLVKSNDAHAMVNFIQGLNETGLMHLAEQQQRFIGHSSKWVARTALYKWFATHGKLLGSSFNELLASKDLNDQMLALRIITQYSLANKSALLKPLTESDHHGVVKIAKEMLELPAAAENQLQPTASDYAKALANASKRLIIQTERGAIKIQLLPSAVYTANNFYQLATHGFYNDSVFHRVVPNFVAQGGASAGSFEGGPGYSIREELYPMSHVRGTLGVATVGKDTGNSQFFFNISDNFHLDGNYSIFARVISGFEIMDALEQGDKIISISEQVN
jgi:cyclophilin family peptidyl-prolyl cis-trans isomerase